MKGRLLFLDALGAGRVFTAETNELHDRFSRMIAGYLDDAVAAGAIPAVDTRLTGIAWFGALNEVILHWLIRGEPKRLEDAYDGLRPLLMKSVGA